MSTPRACFACGSTEHMRKDCPQAKAEGDRPETRACFNCNETGHLSRNCPNPQQQQGEARERRAPAERAPRAPKSCYLCSSTEHVQKDCPDRDQSQPLPPRRTTTRAPRQQTEGGAEGEAPAARRPSRGVKCYNCGELGHISKACPSAELGPRCYRCDKFGHLSSGCDLPAESAA